MPHDHFELACDRLSSIVDPGQFQRLVWARTEAPMLARLVELLHAALEERPDFELGEEGSSNSVKRFVLRIHGTRIFAIAISLHQGSTQIAAEAIERSKFLVKPGEPLSIEFTVVDQDWMAGALKVLFERVQPIRRVEDAQAEEPQRAAFPPAKVAQDARPAAPAARSRTL